MAKITIAAVGDLLMKGKIIASARRPGQSKYAFGPMFARVAPYLRGSDITIGNLETTFSGGKAARRSGKYERRSKRTGFPLFNCPDELAAALKQAGFNVVTTANNHCMDNGAAGLKRTLTVLDRHRLRHTGTARSPKEAGRRLIVSAKGIKVGIAAYTVGTNRIRVPYNWLVNRTHPKRIAADLKDLKRRSDLVMVCLHFGQEYRRTPNEKQKKLVRYLLTHGADAVLGAHPHVLQPVVYKKGRVVAYSLGNFLSSRLCKNMNTMRGMILRMTVTKNRRGKTRITAIKRIRTHVRRIRRNRRDRFIIVPDHRKKS